MREMVSTPSRSFGEFLQKGLAFQFVRLFHPLIYPFGVDLFCLKRKFLLLNLVGRSIKLRYRKSVLGILWTLILPLAVSGVYFTVFKFVVRLEIPNYAAYIVFGIIPWALFAQTVVNGMESVGGNYGIMAKIPIPFNVFPLAIAVSNTINLLITLPVLIAIAVMTTGTVKPAILVLPLFGLFFFLITYGIGTILSVLLIFFRDLRPIMTVVMQMWMYATPILYTPEMIPENFRWIVAVNPIAGVVISIREALLYGRWPAPLHLVSALAWSVFLVAACALVVKRVKDHLVEMI